MNKGGVGEEKQYLIAPIFNQDLSIFANKYYDIILPLFEIVVKFHKQRQLAGDRDIIKEISEAKFIELIYNNTSKPILKYVDWLETTSSLSSFSNYNFCDNKDYDPILAYQLKVMRYEEDIRKLYELMRNFVENSSVIGLMDKLHSGKLFVFLYPKLYSYF